MKKIRIVLVIALCLIFSGCSIRNNKFLKDTITKNNDKLITDKKETIDNEKNNTEKTDNEKSIVCEAKKDTTSQNEIEVNSTLKFNFKNENATTVDMIINIKLLSTSAEDKTTFDSYNEEKLKEVYENAFKYEGIDEKPNIETNIKKISDNEKQITLTFAYTELLKIYAEDHDDAEKYKDTSFDNVYNMILDTFNSDNSLTCVYDGKVITKN